jgi:hypothetical protein
VLHSEQMDWDTIGSHLNRSGTAVQAHWRQLHRKEGSCGPGGSQAVLVVPGEGAACGHCGLHFDRQPLCMLLASLCA